MKLQRYYNSSAYRSYRFAGRSTAWKLDCQQMGQAHVACHFFRAIIHSITARITAYACDIIPIFVIQRIELGIT